MRDKCMETVIQEIFSTFLSVCFVLLEAKLWGIFGFVAPFCTEKTSRRKLSCTTQSGTVIYSEQSSL